MSKGIAWGKEIDYMIAPKTIRVEVSKGSSYCDNCASHGEDGDHKVYRLIYNSSDFSDAKGKISTKVIAKERQLWLCEDCAEELFKALKEAMGE